VSIITLTTDWNNGDYYLSAIKGKLVSLLPSAYIVDISHQIPTYGYIKAAFILRNCFRTFPKGTVHILGVNSEATKTCPHIAIMHEGHFFIGADNGAFGLMFNAVPEKIVHLEHSAITTFPEYDVFADAAVYLAKSGDIDQLGASRKELFTPSPLRATIDEAIINGSVIYIDSFGNAITNITYDIFEKVRKNRRFEILVQSNYYKINKLNKLYSETPENEILALFNTANLLEIAISKGNAAELLNLDNNATVRVKFYDTPEREELKLI